MIAPASRPSGLDIPFVEMDPIFPARTSRPESNPDFGALEAGELIADRYRVLRKIGEGGMGVLYACEDRVLARKVAVKLMQRSIAADPGLSERLLREARLAAQLRKHVAQVFDCGTLDTGEPYIVMELLHGRDLYAVLKESGPLPPAELVGYLLEVCDGLAEAHEQSIIHRDLKPENLYCAEQPDGSTVLKIVDFGVSKQLSSRHLRSQTNPSESVGSPQYMSPEQISSPSDVDCRTDIWSLGVVMFELLTGHLPFNGAGPAQVCASVLTGVVPPLSDYRDDVPPVLEAILRRCLQRDRARRFASVRELAAALLAISAADEWSDPSLDASMSLAPRAPRARRWLGALCAVVVIGACAAVLVLAVQKGRIRLPAAADLQRLPASISAWRLPFLTPTPAPEPGPTAQAGPVASPPAPPEPAPPEQRPLAPAAPAAPATPLTDVQVRAPAPAVSVPATMSPTLAPTSRASRPTLDRSSVSESAAPGVSTSDTE
jgi:eukaryotic-like serine/threonine-protein kinase